jgi:hypothetical protein
MAESEVMDLLLKIGVTEEVTDALKEMSRLFERIHHQAAWGLCRPRAAPFRSCSC